MAKNRRESEKKSKRKTADSKATVKKEKPKRTIARRKSALPEKIGRYIAIGAGLATIANEVYRILRHLMAMVHSASATGRSFATEVPYAVEARRLLQLYNDAFERLGSITPDSRPDEFKQIVDSFPDWWNSLPSPVQLALRDYLVVDERHQTLFSAIIDDVDRWYDQKRS